MNNKMSRAVWLGLLSVIYGLNFAQAKTCMYVASYHKGYPYQNQLEGGLLPALKGACELEIIYMDARRNATPEYSKKKALEIKEIIETKKPDVVLVSSVNAIGDLMATHFKNSTTPFVFFGISWTVDRFGLPYENATGILNIPQSKENIKEILKSLPNAKLVYYLGDDHETTRVGSKQQAKLFESFGLSLKVHLVKTTEEWKKVFMEAQEKSDLMALGGYGAIPDFNRKEMEAFVEKNIKKFVISGGRTLLPMAAFGNATYAEELGEWAGETTKKILGGKRPKDIPIANNKRFDAFINPKILSKLNIKLSESFMKRAKIFDPKDAKIE